VLAALALTLSGVCAATQHAVDAHDADVIHLPTPHPVVDAMLELARVRAGDVLYDLGAGDGRIAIAAARRFGIRAVGIEINAPMVEIARANVRHAGVEHLVEIRHADALEVDVREASIVTLFLFPELNLKLRPRLRSQLRPGARIVSHRFDLGDWMPDGRTTVRGHPLYVWTIAAP
jgi:precorrin-6B methylase 2